MGYALLRVPSYKLAVQLLGRLDCEGSYDMARIFRLYKLAITVGSDKFLLSFCR